MRVVKTAVIRLPLFGLLLGGIVACSQHLQQSGDAVEEVDLSTGGEERLYIPEQSSVSDRSSAVDALLASADSAVQAGDYQRAAAYVERVIRMAPNDARAYFSLAQVHYYQNQPELGSSFLAKAESLAVTNKTLSKAIQQFKGRLP